jgi:outer membrane immunogenic protein
MITGRLGYAWGRTLIYVKGDAAFVPVRASVLDQGNTPATGCGNWLISTSAGGDTLTTATLGGGVEWAFANNWSIKGEYMFIGLGDHHCCRPAVQSIAPGGNIVGARLRSA